MTAVCSWCGNELGEKSPAVEFICEACYAKAKADEASSLVGRRDWRPWMPVDRYPRLDKGDTRRA